MRTPDMKGLSPMVRARLGVVDDLDLSEPVRGVSTRVRGRLAEARTAVAPIELRDDGGDGGLHLAGYASTYDQAYNIGGPTPEDGGWGWDEIIAAGAAKKSIQIKGRAGVQDDVVFLVNHDGNPLSRTKNGTLELAEDSTGLWSDGRLNPAIRYHVEVYEMVRSGLFDQMSFAFRVIRERWEDRDGNEMSWMEAPVRRIQEVELFDTSVVTFPANPGTSIAVDGERGMSLDEARRMLPGRLTLADARAMLT